MQGDACSAAVEELKQKGFLLASVDELANWALHRFDVSGDLRSGLLRGGNDPLRLRAL